MRHEGHEHHHHHDHDHDHPHTHCHGNCGACDQDPKAELMALMRYMVNHNTAHANELAEFAKRLDAMGDHTACEQVMQAVADFEKGNLRLSTVLAAMEA